MPLKNHFAHQKYHAEEPKAPWQLVEASYPPQQGSDAFAATLESFAGAVDGNVDAIWFVHGTFAGHDALGWFGQLERVIPAAGPVLKNLGKKLTDLLAGDSGNFTPSFVESIEVPIPTRRFVWSGENTHSGRCRAAIEFLDELLQRSSEEKRVMIWGHSHAGNVAALVTNLIGAEPWVRDQFFALVEPLFPKQDDRIDMLSRVRAAIDSNLAMNLEFDIVNFGAPITYGWDTAGYRKLIHIVNHLPQNGKPEWIWSPVEAGKKFRGGAQGDFVHLFGITGSNFLPWLLTKTSRDSEAKLHDFLAPDCSRRDWWSRAGIGMRVAEEGETFLVRYENTDGHASETLGHSVYTKAEWLAFHLELIAEMY